MTRVINNSLHIRQKCSRCQRTLAFPLVFPCIFWKFEVGERFGLKYGGGGTAFPRVPPYFNHWQEYCSQAAWSNEEWLNTVHHLNDAAVTVSHCHIISNAQSFKVLDETTLKVTTVTGLHCSIHQALTNISISSLMMYWLTRWCLIAKLVYTGPSYYSDRWLPTSVYNPAAQSTQPPIPLG